MDNVVRVLDLGAASAANSRSSIPPKRISSAGRISVLAPLGTALLGFREGDELEWLMPGGLRRLRIERVRSGHETVLCATDLLPKSEAAIERGRFLTEARDAELTMLYAISPDASDGRHARATGCAARRSAAHYTHFPAAVAVGVRSRHRGELRASVPGGARHRVSASRAPADARSASRRCLRGRDERHHHRTSARRRGFSGADRAAGSGRRLPQRAGCARRFASIGPAGAKWKRSRWPKDSFATVLHAHEPLYEGMMNTVGVGSGEHRRLCGGFAGPGRGTHRYA